MSKIQFIKSPFPDNHNGFDYAPASFMDVQREDESKKVASSESQILSMLLSILK